MEMSVGYMDLMRYMYPMEKPMGYMYTMDILISYANQDYSHFNR